MVVESSLYSKNGVFGTEKNFLGGGNRSVETNVSLIFSIVLNLGLNFSIVLFGRSCANENFISNIFILKNSSYFNNSFAE